MANMTTLEFFQRLYGPETLNDTDLFIGITLLPQRGGGGGLTHRFQSLEEAAKFCHDKRETYSVYYNMALHKENLGKHVRGTWENAAGHFGIYFDIDLKTDVEAHKKTNHPADIKEAMAMFAEAFGKLKPSMIVSSGYGLHVYCLAPEPIILKTKQEIYEHQVYLERAQQRLKNIFNSHGYHLDGVQDITRIFRPVGTLNHKSEAGSVEVTLIKENKERHSMEEWMSHCPERGQLDAGRKVMTKMEEALNVKVVMYDPKQRDILRLDKEHEAERREAKRAKSTVVNSGIIVNLDVERPVEVINAMQAESAAFARDFNRRDIASRKDTSPSSYDMSLANACKNAGLSDQLTADIIVVFHRDHYSHTDKNWAKKLLRSDYLPNTIEKAKQKFVSAKAQAELEAAPIKRTYDKEQIKENIKVISEALGVQIEEIIKYQGDNSQYDIVLADEGGTVRFPNTERLITYRHFKTIFADKTGILIPPMKADKWEPIAQAILNSSSIKKIHGVDNCTIVADYIYTSFKRAANLEGWRNAHMTKSTFMKGDDGYVFCETIFDMLRMDGRVMGMGEVAAAMTRIGCISIKRNFYGNKEQRQQAWCWRVPKAIVNGEHLGSDSVEDGDEDTD